MPNQPVKGDKFANDPFQADRMLSHQADYSFQIKGLLSVLFGVASTNRSIFSREADVNRYLAQFCIHYTLQRPRPLEPKYQRNNTIIFTYLHKTRL